MAEAQGWPGTLVAVVLFAACSTAEASGPTQGAPSPEDLAEMSLEELGNLEVTSVSRHAQRLSDAAASVFVITAEDIRRSGATSLPEVLRLAPNLDVARIDTSVYAVSARGFNNGIGNKLQVLLDGRILYSPLFSGMFWDAHDLVLRDVERIEVVSGPGATLWGANAVTGVINIISRPATDTRGGYVRVADGSDDRHVSVRYGAGEATGAFRVSAKFADRDATHDRTGAGREDAYHDGVVDFRGDWERGRDRYTLSAGAFRSRADSRAPDDLTNASQDLGAEWTRSLADAGTVRLQALVEHRDRSIPGSVHQSLHIADVEFQHDVGGLEHHVLAWGASHRVASDDVDNDPGVAFLPARSRLHWSSVYVQDELALREGRVHLTGGLRIEDNSYTGIEVLPTLRLAWKVHPDHLLWASATRAVRTPSRFDVDLYSPEQPPFLLAGGPGFESEIADVFELGWRAQPSPRATVSVTVFHQRYDRLRSFEIRGAHIEIGNGMVGTGNGLEAWGAFQVMPSWRLTGGIALLDQDLRLRADSTDPVGPAAAGNDPRQQWQVHSLLDLPHGFELDADVRHVGARPSPADPAYTTFDVRLGWRPRPEVELSLAARNLGDDHVEFGIPATTSESDPAWQASVRWDF